MESSVASNDRNFIVRDCSCGERLSVMISPITFENPEYGGVTALHQASLSSGILTFLRYNPRYRKSQIDKWTHTDDKATLLVLVLDFMVYIIIGEDHQPLLVPRDYSGFEEIAVKCGRDNFVELTTYL